MCCMFVRPFLFMMFLCVYLNVATGLLEISIIKSVITVADGEFGNIFDTVWSTLYRDCRYISYTTQINYQLLLEIGVFGSPRCSSLKSMVGEKNHNLNLYNSIKRLLQVLLLIHMHSSHDKIIHEIELEVI